MKRWLFFGKTPNAFCIMPMINMMACEAVWFLAAANVISQRLSHTRWPRSCHCTVPSLSEKEYLTKLLQLTGPPPPYLLLPRLATVHSLGCVMTCRKQMFECLKKQTLFYCRHCDGLCLTLTDSGNGRRTHFIRDKFFFCCLKKNNNNKKIK